MGSCPFSSIHGPLTKLFKVLRGYFQLLPCTFNGSGEKVNEFNTVSRDSPYSGHRESVGAWGFVRHADEVTAVKESVAAPLRLRLVIAVLW